jgi:hypothetical protein
VSETPPPPAPSDEPGPFSERPTRADPIESEARAASLRSKPPSQPPPDDPPSVPPLPLESAKASLAPRPIPAVGDDADVAPRATTSLASVPPRASELPPDGSRRILTALVGITGAAVGIAIVAIIFAARDPSPAPSVPTSPTANVVTTPPPPAKPTAPDPPASSPVAEPSTIQVTMDVSPNYARVYLDKERLKAPYARTLPRDGADHELKIEAPGHKTKKIPFKASGDLALVVALEALPKKKKNPTTNEDIY